MPYQFDQTYSCSVIFFDLVGFSKLANDSQSATKARFYDLLRQSLVGRDSADRVQIDTGDGAAIAFLSNPEEAFRFLVCFSELKSSFPDLKIRSGAHLGPCKLVQDINGAPNLIGDGINAAQRVMDFAPPGVILVSHAFHDMAKWISGDHVERFRHLKMRADKHGRKHDLYCFCLNPDSDPGDFLLSVAEPPASRIPSFLLLSGILGSIAVAIGVWLIFSPTSMQKSEVPVEKAPQAKPAPIKQSQPDVRVDVGKGAGHTETPVPDKKTADQLAEVKSADNPETPDQDKEPKVAVVKTIAKPSTPPPKKSPPASVAVAFCPTCNCAELYTKVSLGVQKITADERKFLQQNCH
ncbi:MAG: hypothetical protein Q8O37_05060 [Sulfuricellaceae bacterium]|nr:hypothetical protein [Sulfuricellaceae bacterium]